MISKFLTALAATHDAKGHAIAADRYPGLARLADQEGHGDIARLTVQVTTKLPSTRRKQTEFTLHLGFPSSPDATELYTRHLCSVMAAAMHHHTKWPLAIITSPTCWHAGVITPEGTFMDIGGTHQIDRAADFNATIERFDTLAQASESGFPRDWCGVSAVTDGTWVVFAETTLYLAETIIRDHGWIPA